jgi:purine-nucleoside phosphorylase
MNDTSAPVLPVPPVAAEAAAAVAARTGVATHDVAIILGSGWRPTADLIGAAEFELPLADLPGFPPPAVEGHGGTVRSLDVAGRRVLMFLGRTHYYEHRDIDAVVHNVHVAHATGCRALVVTNSCGGIRAGLVPPQPVLITDFINPSGLTPLRGGTFVDMTDAFSPRLRALARDVDPSLEEGVYGLHRGPQYETPAEIRMLATLGADLAGMSTVPECIQARAYGMEVLGISLVTNVAAGLAGATLDHQEVIRRGAEAASRVGDLIRTVLERMTS